MNLQLPEWLIDRLIARAMRTPYVHIGDYMFRYWLLNPREGDTTKGRLSIRLHHTLRSDRDDAFHDHPWANMSWLLRGRYREVTPVFRHGIYNGDRVCEYGPGDLILRRASTWHRLVLDPGVETWSMFFIGPWQQTWGFLTTPEYKTHWRQWLDYSGPYPPPVDSAHYHRKIENPKQ